MRYSFHRSCSLFAIGMLATLLACGGSSSPTSPLAPQGPAVPIITKVTTLAGVNGQSGTADGGPGYGQLAYPQGLALDSKGNLFVADHTASTIRRITPAGVMTTFAGLAETPGGVDGQGAVARFDHPTGLAIDAADNLYVADTYNSTIRKITPAGVVTTLAGWMGHPGFRDDQGTLAQVSMPRGLAIDTNGNLYVADTANQRIRKVTPGGLVSTVAGIGVEGLADGALTTATLECPHGIAVASDGTVYFTEYRSHLVRKVSQGQILTIAGKPGTPGFSDGIGTAASFCAPAMLSLDAAGALYVADRGNHILRKVLSDGTATTVAGTPSSIGYGTGPVASVKLDNPYGCLVSGTRVYVSQLGSSVVQIFD